jgi:hypothetical protein
VSFSGQHDQVPPSLRRSARSRPVASIGSLGASPRAQQRGGARPPRRSVPKGDRIRPLADVVEMRPQRVRQGAGRDRGEQLDVVRSSRKSVLAVPGPGMLAAPRRRAAQQRGVRARRARPRSRTAMTR